MDRKSLTSTSIKLAELIIQLSDSLPVDKITDEVATARIDAFETLIQQASHQYIQPE